MQKKNIYIRKTKQRNLIFSKLKSTKQHPTAEAIYATVKKELPHISLGTIYRNLHILKKEGQIKEIKTTGRKSHYDADISSHSHFICKKCNQVIDCEVNLPSNIFANIKNQMFDKITNPEIYLYGFCIKCYKK